jgi:hypothetical protein
LDYGSITPVPVAGSVVVVSTPVPVVSVPGVPVPDVLALAGGLKPRDERRPSGAAAQAVEEGERYRIEREGR